jgi:hypothetical protein
MILVAGGDSFTYGSELKDGVTPFNPHGTEPAQPQVSLSTFPALLAKEFGMQYECAAYPGFSNSAIRRTTMNTCERLQDIGLVVVNWSFAGRYEFRFNYDTEERWGNWYSVTPWSIIDDIEIIKRDFKTDNPIILVHHINNLNRAKRTGVAEFAKAFYRHVGDSNYWQCYSSLSEIVLLQQYLTSKKIPYVFSMVDESILTDCLRINDENITTLYNQIDFDRWISFPNNQGFYTWARDNNYPFGTTHPLELAHSDAAEIFKRKINELDTKNN